VLRNQLQSPRRNFQDCATSQPGLQLAMFLIRTSRSRHSRDVHVLLLLDL
jgi:hypothetical protein